MSPSTPKHRERFVIVRKDPNKESSNPIAFFATLSAANTALSDLCGSPKPSPFRTGSSASTSTIGSMSDDDGNEGAISSHAGAVDGNGARLEVRKIGYRSVCGSLMWWFVDEKL